MFRQFILVPALLMTGAAFAQSGHGNHAMPAELPQICRVEAGAHAGHSGSTATPMAGEMDEGHQALMQSMAGMHEKMAAGMMAEDLDVAFVCGMIPHHQGAIEMARAELEHGDDPWAKEMAEKIIAAQEAEIAEMVAWLEKQPR